MRFKLNMTDDGSAVREMSARAEEIWHSTPAGLVGEVLANQGGLGLAALYQEVRQYQDNNPAVGLDPVEPEDLVEALADMLALDIVTASREPAQPCGEEIVFTRWFRLHPADLHPITRELQDALPDLSGYTLDEAFDALHADSPGNAQVTVDEMVRALHRLTRTGSVKVAVMPARLAVAS